MPEQRRYFVGLDLGQARDFSAVAVLDRPLVTPDTPRQERRPAYLLRHLQRFPLGTPYPEVVEGVVRLLQAPPLSGALLVVDQTGVGRPVVDLLADRLRGQVTCKMTAVTITGGSAVTAGEGCMNVPKKELVGALQVLLQARRLHVAQSLPEAPVLVRELEHFRGRITASARESFEAWRDGQHDDWVLACALAAWAAELCLPGLDERPPPRQPTRIVSG